MKRLFWVAALLAAVALVPPTASAETIVTYTHLYGSQVSLGQINPTGDDSLGKGYVTIADHTVDSFVDSFDFSGLSYSSISYFDLTLKFTATNYLELWYVQPGGTPATLDFPLWTTGSYVTQTFRIGYPSLGWVADQIFTFRFAETTPSGDSFRLSSAELVINGTVAPVGVPEPATLSLLGLGLVGIARVARRNKK